MKSTPVLFDVGILGRRPRCRDRAQSTPGGATNRLGNGLDEVLVRTAEMIDLMVATFATDCKARGQRLERR